MKMGGKLLSKQEGKSCTEVTLRETLRGAAWGSLSGAQSGKAALAFALFPPPELWSRPPLAEPTVSQRAQEPFQVAHTGYSSQRRLRAASRRAESVSKIINRWRGRHFFCFGSWLYPTCAKSTINMCLGLCSREREWSINASCWW